MALLTRSKSAMLAAGVAVATMSTAHASQPLPSPLLVAQTSPQAAVPTASKPRQLNLEHQAWTGDFDAMVERRLIRVLVPYSRTLYLQRQGPRARHHRRARARLRALHQQEVREAARQASDHGLSCFRPRATSCCRSVVAGARRHRRRQPHRYRRAAEDRRLRRAARTAQPIASCRHRPDRAARSRRSTNCPARRFTCARRRATTKAWWR